jgi:hypothetical protein
LTLISKIVYGGVDALFGIYLFVIAAPVPFFDTVGLFLMCRAAMTFINLRLAADSMPFKLFYGGGDAACGLFFLSNAAFLGGESGGIGLFLFARGLLTSLGIFIA